MTVARAKTLSHPLIAAMQRRHFVVLDIAPFVATAIALVLLTRIGVTAGDVAVFVAMWALTVVGIEIGYHRFFSHDAFAAHPAVKGVLVILASMGGQGTVISWAANHRYHHECSDTPRDSHTPHHSGSRLRGFLHAQLLWKWSYPYPNPSLYTPKLLRDPLINGLSRFYFVWVALGIALPAAAGWLLDGTWLGASRGALLGGVVRLFVSQQGTFLVNSLCHMVGTRPYRTRDRSTNNFWFVPLSLGGAWHNNHHAFPYSASNTLRWWHVDPSYWIIWCLARLGLVWNVRTVSRRAEVGRRRSGDAVAEVEETGERDVLAAANR